MDDSKVFTSWCQCAPFPTHAMLPLWSTRVHTANSLLIGSAVFAQLMAEGPYTSQCPCTQGFSSTCFLGLTQVRIPNSMLIRSAVFARLTIATDRPCYYACNNRLHRLVTSHLKFGTTYPSISGFALPYQPSNVISKRTYLSSILHFTPAILLTQRLPAPQIQYVAHVTYVRIIIVLRCSLLTYHLSETGDVKVKVCYIEVCGVSRS